MINFVHNRPARVTAAFDVTENTPGNIITVTFAIAACSPADQWNRKMAIQMAGKRLERGRNVMEVKIAATTIDLSYLAHKDAKTGQPFVQKRTHWVADQFVFFIKGLKKRRIPRNLENDFAGYLINKGVTILNNRYTSFD